MQNNTGIALVERDFLLLFTSSVLMIAKGQRRNNRNALYVTILQLWSAMFEWPSPTQSPCKLRLAEMVNLRMMASIKAGCVSSAHPFFAGVHMSQFPKSIRGCDPHLPVSKLSREPPFRACSLWTSLLRCFCKPG